MRWIGIIVTGLLLLGGCSDSDGDTAELFGFEDETTVDERDAAGDTSAEPNDDAQPAEEPPAGDEPAAPPEGVDRSTDLVGTWNVTFYALPDGGGRTNVIAGSAPVQITFDADGTATYHTGCNAGSTTFATDGVYVVPESALDETPEGQPVTIDQGMQEEQGCEGFLGEQDVDLPAAWRQAERFRLDGDLLILSAEFFLLEAERG